MSMSPRISFSNDTLDAAAAAPHRLDDSLISISTQDFDFVINNNSNFSNGSISNQEFDLSPADDLFSHGMLLPLSSLNINSKATPLEKPKINSNYKHLLKDILSSSVYGVDQASSSSGIGRSSSVGTTKSGTRKDKTQYFPRSRSTGSYLNPNHKNQNNARNCTYYYSGSRKRSGGVYGNGVRIDPVINVPATFLPRGSSSGSNSSTTSSGGSRTTGGGGGGGFFAYLLCSCKDKNIKETEV